jgi:hypothetical protein
LWRRKSRENERSVNWIAVAGIVAVCGVLAAVAGRHAVCAGPRRKSRLQTFMKKLTSLAAALAVAVLIGCATTGTTVYRTLATVQITTSSAYNAYLDLVVQGKVSTNMVPVVSRDYTAFVAVWNGAVGVAALGVQAPATAPVIDAANKVIADVAVAKGTP